MPFTTIAVQNTTRGALTTTAADASNGNRYLNDGFRRLVVFNPDGASIAVVLNIPTVAEDDLAAGNNIDPPTIAFTSTRYILEALEPRLYNVRSGTDAGYVTFTMTGTLTNVLLVVL